MIRTPWQLIEFNACFLDTIARDFPHLYSTTNVQRCARQLLLHSLRQREADLMARSHDLQVNP